MKLFEYEYNGENYVFETTNKARAELKDLQMKGVKDFSAGDYLELMTDIKNLEIEGAKIDVMPESEEKTELASLLEQKLIEVADKTQAMSIVLDNAELTTLDTMYVILKNTRKFKGNLSLVVKNNLKLSCLQMLFLRFLPIKIFLFLII